MRLISYAIVLIDLDDQLGPKQLQFINIIKNDHKT